VHHVAAVLSKDATSILIASGKFEADEAFPHTNKLIHFQGLTADLALTDQICPFHLKHREASLEGAENSLRSRHRFPAPSRNIPCSLHQNSLLRDQGI